MPSTRLEEIVAAHRAAAGKDDRDPEALIAQAAALPAPRPFAGALAEDGLSVIAEIKRRSPSAGALAPSLDAAALARAYEAGGASCLSVLTDSEYFGGSPDDVVSAREAVSLPVLRKDFTVDLRDVADARLMGADAVLLIVAALDDAELRSFAEVAARLGVAALFEVHDRTELLRAQDAGASIVGVNQRNLHTFEIDYALAETLAPDLTDVISVAESGVRDAADATRLRAAGYDAVLVGTSLVTSSGPTEAVRALVEAGAG